MIGTFSTLPPNLPSGERYVVWTLEQRRGQQTKVPRVPHAPERGADVTDPRTWSTLEHACTVVRAGHADGIGLVLNGTDVAAVDYDHCADRRTHTLTVAARELVAELQSYSEWSVTDGIHVLVEAALPPGPRQRAGFGFYDDKRFVTLSGWRLPRVPREIRTCPQLAALYARLLPQPTPTGSAPPPDRPRGNSLTDRELLRRAHHARNGELFAHLWAGDTSRYPSASEADLALAAFLVFWTNHDLERADALFRRSGLYRQKRWDAASGGQTYGARTLAQADRTCWGGYRPPLDLVRL